MEYVCGRRSIQGRWSSIVSEKMVNEVACLLTSKIGHICWEEGIVI